MRGYICTWYHYVNVMDAASVVGCWLLFLFPSFIRSNALRTHRFYSTVVSRAQRWLRCVALYILRVWHDVCKCVCVCVRGVEQHLDMYLFHLMTDIYHFGIRVFDETDDQYYSWLKSFLVWFFTSRWCPIPAGWLADWLTGWLVCACADAIYYSPKNEFVYVCIHTHTHWLSCFLIRICFFVNFSKSVCTLESS